MSLTALEEFIVRLQIGYDARCEKCGDELVIHDDGVSYWTAWGVSGAYVICESCGCELEKTNGKS